VKDRAAVLDRRGEPIWYNDALPHVRVLLALALSSGAFAGGCSVGEDTEASFADDPRTTQLRISMLGGQKGSRGVSVYTAAERPSARVALAPALPDRQVSFLVQSKSGGLWLDVRSELVTTDVGGRATVRLGGLRQGIYRAAGHFIGDAANAGVSSSWTYFRVGQ
jgi:hypothetical protein